MSDGITLTSEATTVIAKAATDDIPYSGDPSQHVSLVRLVQINGVEGAKSIGTLNRHIVSTGSAGDAVNVKNTAALLYSIVGFNNAPYPVYVKLHNTSGVPTAGASVYRTFGVQAGQPLPPMVFPHGLSFSLGIGLTIVKGLADNNAVAVAASDCVLDLEYT